MKLIKCERKCRYLFQVDRLWEERDLDWVKRFAAADLNVKAVRKAIHESRGVMEVEFWGPTAPDLVLAVAESKTKESSGGEGPTHGHYYRVKSDVLVRMSPSNFAMEPITLEKGVEFKQVDVITGGQWVFSVVTGKCEGAHIIVSPDEWRRISPKVADLGTSFTRGHGQADEPEDPRLQPAPDGSGDTKSRPPGPKGPMPGMTPMATRRKKAAFPPFPKRPSLDNYLTKKVKK